MNLCPVYLGKYYAVAVSLNAVFSLLMQFSIIAKNITSRVTGYSLSCLFLSNVMFSAEKNMKVRFTLVVALFRSTADCC